MGLCHGKQSITTQHQFQKPEIAYNEVDPTRIPNSNEATDFPLYSPSPVPTSYHSSPRTSTPTTPLRVIKHPFPPPSPAKHIKAFLAVRHRKTLGEAIIDEGDESELPEVVFDKNFGYSRQLFAKYELGKEVGRGHFGYTCSAWCKKGPLKGQEVAVKVILKSKMTTPIAMGDVKREVSILQSLSGHDNLVSFYDSFEDDDNVYIVMELCRGGELLDRILAKGGNYPEEEAKAIMVQIVSVAAYCHLQGVVHRDFKPENFLFSTEDTESSLKAIDFGLSDFVRPDERLTDIVGSAYYVAPEVLQRSYGTEADMWSIGVIAYILLCGSRPFWARSESAVFRSIIKLEPNFEDDPWPSLPEDAKDFVKKLLHKDYRKRLTAAQALCHPWLSSTYQDITIPLDILTLKLVKSYIFTSPLRRAALVAMEKMLPTAQLVYFQKQFALLGPNKNGFISVQNFKSVLSKCATDAMKDSQVLDYASMMNSLQYKKLDFEEFCAAALSVHQMEGMENWEQHAVTAYQHFEKDGNRLITVDELISELGLSSTIPMHTVQQDWIRQSDGKLSLQGYMRLLHGASSGRVLKVLR